MSNWAGLTVPLTIAYTNWGALENIVLRRKIGTQNATVLPVQLLQVLNQNSRRVTFRTSPIGLAPGAVVVTVRATSGDFGPLGV